MRKAAFLNRDGILTKPVFRNGRWRAPLNFQEFKILPQASSAVARLKNLGLLCIVVTNQPEVGTGEISSGQLDLMHSALLSDTLIDAIFFCTHTRIDYCQCRKPKPGLILEAAKKWDIDLGRSYMIGDRFSDMDAGQAVGCTTILVFSEATHGDDAKFKGKAFLAHNLERAVDIIEYLEQNVAGRSDK